MDQKTVDWIELQQFDLMDYIFIFKNDETDKVIDFTGKQFFIVKNSFTEKKLFKET